MCWRSVPWPRIISMPSAWPRWCMALWSRYMAIRSSASMWNSPRFQPWGSFGQKPRIIRPGVFPYSTDRLPPAAAQALVYGHGRIQLLLLRLYQLELGFQGIALGHQHFQVIGTCALEQVVGDIDGA